MNMTFQSCVKIINEWDIVAARQLGRKISKEIGFGTVDQARITTAISELARNIFLYAGRGEICIEKVSESGKQGMIIVAKDKRSRYCRHKKSNARWLYNIRWSWSRSSRSQTFNGQF